MKIDPFFFKKIQNLSIKISLNFNQKTLFVLQTTLKRTAYNFIRVYALVNMQFDTDGFTFHSQDKKIIVKKLEMYEY